MSLSVRLDSPSSSPSPDGPALSHPADPAPLLRDRSEVIEEEDLLSDLLEQVNQSRDEPVASLECESLDFNDSIEVERDRADKRALLSVNNMLVLYKPYDPSEEPELVPENEDQRATIRRLNDAAVRELCQRVFSDEEFSSKLFNSAQEPVKLSVSRHFEHDILLPFVQLVCMSADRPSRVDISCHWPAPELSKLMLALCSPPIECPPRRTRLTIKIRDAQFTYRRLVSVILRQSRESPLAINARLDRVYVVGRYEKPGLTEAQMEQFGRYDRNEYHPRDFFAHEERVIQHPMFYTSSLSLSIPCLETNRMRVEMRYESEYYPDQVEGQRRQTTLTIEQCLCPPPGVLQGADREVQFSDHVEEVVFPIEYGSLYPTPLCCASSYRARTLHEWLRDMDDGWHEREEPVQAMSPSSSSVSELRVDEAGSAEVNCSMSEPDWLDWRNAY